jgi:hypothetical protein
MSPKPFGPGEWQIDDAPGDPDPTPVTTIAWRRGHPHLDFAGTWEWTFGGRRQPPADLVDFSPSAAVALERFWATMDRWRDSVAAVTPSSSTPSATASTPTATPPSCRSSCSVTCTGPTPRARGRPGRTTHHRSRPGSSPNHRAVSESFHLGQSVKGGLGRCRCCLRPQPERRPHGLHGVVDHGQQLGAESVQVDLVP